ncbi:hypothetical protein [Myxococcus virescens]|nr:hypothetical protein [Myxococcus virescens]GEL75692.1 hypothetical protein MVI01_74760 [Myxococcus virescens]
MIFSTQVSCDGPSISTPWERHQIQPLRDETWYGTFTYKFEQWSDSDDGHTSGCLSQATKSTYRNTTTIDVISDENGARIAVTSDTRSRDTETREECSGCIRTEIDDLRRKANGTTEADIYIGVSLEDGISLLDIAGWDSVIENIKRVRKVHNTCTGNSENTTQGTDEIYSYFSELGEVQTGHTPGQLIVHGASEEVDDGSSSLHYRITKTWRFTNYPHVRLVIDAVNLDNWRPLGTVWNGTGSPPTTPGATLSLVASLHPKPSVAPNPIPKATKITFKIVESSNVPGDAMNSPLDNAANSLRDLQFQAGQNPAMTFVDVDTIHTPSGLVEEASAVLSSFDWGAYGSVTAEAVLEDGTVLTARFRDTGDNPMRIPKRESTSYIADSWRLAAGVADLPDSSDEETLSGGAGDGHSGDGLTLYEEYRGFVANGQWGTTDPAKVEFHVYNGLHSYPSILTQVTAGIQTFKNATGLNVHSNYREADFEQASDPSDIDPSKRVINFNALHEGGRHRVDQHIIMLMPSINPLSVVSQTHRGPSSPVNIPMIEIGQMTDPGDIAGTVAHELAHSANVPHHGENGHDFVTWIPQVTDYLEISTATPAPGVPITLRMEADGSLAPILANPLQMLLLSIEVTDPTKGSRFGGDENCLIRYYGANAVKWNSKPSAERFLILPRETPGTQLCSDGLGKTFNATVRPDYSPPESRPSRHGHAAPNRGNCIHRICINDAHAHIPQNAP